MVSKFFGGLALVEQKLYNILNALLRMQMILHTVTPLSYLEEHCFDFQNFETKLEFETECICSEVEAYALLQTKNRARQNWAVCLPRYG